MNKKVLIVLGTLSVMTLIGCSKGREIKESKQPVNNVVNNNVAGSQTETVVEEATVSEETAIEMSKEKISTEEKKTIKNFDNPIVETVTFQGEPPIYKYNKDAILDGKTAYKITYNTTDDGMMGPITIYIGTDEAVTYGSDYRE